MQNRIISIIVGTALVLGVGSVVHTTKKPPTVPVEAAAPDTGADQARQAVSPASTQDFGGWYESEDDDYDDGYRASAGTSPAVSAPVAPAPAQSGAQTPASSGGITLSQIAQHGSRTSCWSAVNGSVYDLTSWIPNHPGGEQAILSMCGVDGSAGYNAQHGGSSKVARILTGFRIGAFAH